MTAGFLHIELLMAGAINTGHSQVKYNVLSKSSDAPDAQLARMRAVAGAINAAEVILREKTTPDDQQCLSRGYVTQLDAAARGTGGLS